MLTGADTRLDDTLGGLFVLTGCDCSRAVDYLMTKEQHDAAVAIVCHRHCQEHRPRHSPGARGNTTGAKNIRHMISRPKIARGIHFCGPLVLVLSASCSKRGLKSSSSKMSKYLTIVTPPVHIFA